MFDNEYLCIDYSVVTLFSGLGGGVPSSHGTDGDARGGEARRGAARTGDAATSACLQQPAAR